MSQKTRQYFVDKFVTGYTPSQQDFTDLFDSYLNFTTDGNPRPYDVYVAKITQSGANAPVSTVLENTFGVTFDWVRVSTGLYYIQFSENSNLWISGFSSFAQNTGVACHSITDLGGTITGYYTIYVSSDRVILQCFSGDLSTAKDLSDLIDSDPFFLPEIRVY